MFKDLLLHLEEENYAFRLALEMQRDLLMAVLDPESNWRKLIAQDFKDQDKKFPPCG